LGFDPLDDSTVDSRPESQVSFDRPHADKNQNRPEGCSGKKERAMRKEQMREYQAGRYDFGGLKVSY